MEKVIVGLSGGVDSAVAAYLLKEQGYEVIGITLRTWQADDGEESRCCEIDDARAAAFQIGIPFYPVNCLAEFEKSVIGPFVQDYVSGLTPNPCVVCNRAIKWAQLVHYAKVLGAEHVATGHYAGVVRLDNGRYTVRKAKYADKDQTYMLCRLTQEQLSMTLMPLGVLPKSEVRRIAAEIGLSAANKPDSQEICFVPDGSYADFVAERAGDAIRGEGNFVDPSGKVLGRHKGIIHYTVGQRKGLGIALGRPVFVKEIRADRNEVVLSDEEEIFSRQILCRDVNLMSIPAMEPGERISCSARIRYRHAGERAVMEMTPSGRVQLTFAAPVRAATPGQWAVFYDGEDRVIGGGVIEKAFPEEDL